MDNKLTQLQQDLQRIENLRHMDDDFLNVCFENNAEATELLLHILLNKSDIQEGI